MAKWRRLVKPVLPMRAQGVVSGRAMRTPPHARLATALLATLAAGPALGQPAGWGRPPATRVAPPPPIPVELGATLGAGVSGDIFLSNRFGNEQAGIDEVHITSTKGTAYRKLGFSAWLGLKMQYRFARKYSVFLEPSYRTAVTSFTNTPALQSRPSMLGVGTGLQMLF